jgi:hypothetical protein
MFHYFPSYSISQLSLWEETGVPGENTHLQTSTMIYIHQSSYRYHLYPLSYGYHLHPVYIILPKENYASFSTHIKFLSHPYITYTNI